MTTRTGRERRSAFASDRPYDPRYNQDGKRQGNFSEPRLKIDVKHPPDLVTSKLPALRAYQHSLTRPPAPPGSFDVAGAERGRAVFDRVCATCHLGGSGTDNNQGTQHAPAETHYDRVRKLGFTADRQRDLVEYLKSR